MLSSPSSTLRSSKMDLSNIDKCSVFAAAERMKCTCHRKSTWLRNVNKMRARCATCEGESVRVWMELKTGKATDRFVLHFAQYVSGALYDVLMPWLPNSSRARVCVYLCESSMFHFRFSPFGENAAPWYQRITSNWFYVKCFGDIFSVDLNRQRHQLTFRLAAANVIRHEWH